MKNKLIIILLSYFFIGNYSYSESIKFEVENTGINPLMGWESSTNTLSELNLEFSTKELAIEYAKKNKIDFEIIEPQKRKIIKKSYADNFLE